MLAASLAGLAACAARVPPPDPAAGLREALASADRLVDAGCYPCLKDAFAIYAGNLARSPVAARKAFATSVLIALREKELGLAASEWMDTAKRLAQPEDQTYLDILAASPWESTGVADYPQPRFLTGDALAPWVAFLGATSLNSPLEEYLRLTIECRMPGSRGLYATAANAQRPALSSPLLRYAFGLCGSAARQDVATVLADDARFAEAAFTLGRYEIGTAITNRNWMRTALPLLTTAHEAYPQAHIMTITLAGVVRARNNLPGALALYDEALQLKPEQRDALLGRVITLSYLGRYEAAAAGATKLLELGTWYVGDAYYWRAWNRYYQKDLKNAEADIASAKKLLQNVDVFTLSGIVAYEQSRRDDARHEFGEVRRMTRDSCTAESYMGLIEADDRAWAASVSAFTAAAVCYDRSVAAVRKELESLPADLEPAERERQASDLDRRLNADMTEADRARRNADVARARLPRP